MREASDAQLVRHILDGNPAHFAEVVKRYDRRVRSLVERSITDPGTRDEIVQQTFYLAFRHLTQLLRPERLESWLARIAANCITEHHRRSKAWQTVAWRILADGIAAQVASAPGEHAWVWDEVRLLPGPFREVLLLRYREGCSYQEIAQRLALPLSTIRGRIYQARGALRQRLSHEDEDHAPSS
ncbi:MAG: RNA polymerase sigma factor [Planctomycetota bacterium]